nr:hypothetical protein [Planctomycetota bacterium]
MPLSRIAAGLLVTAALANAVECSPRVLSPHVADTYSAKAFARFAGWRDLTDDAKVYAVYAYLADPRTGIFPSGMPAIENGESMDEHAAITDPIKMLNVYPIGHCATLGPTVEGLFRDMGLGRTNTLYLPGASHVVAEVEIGDHWAYIDLDLRAVFRRADGTLASMEDAQRDASLWAGPHGPLFFWHGGLENTRTGYAATSIDRRYGFNQGGHTMDVALRQGETLTRWWQPQGGRWNHHPSYGERPFPRNKLDEAPAGPKCKHTGFSVHAHGNGRFDYAPDLTDASSDVADGAHLLDGVAPAADGLRGAGHALFRLRTPWVIAPLVGDPDTPDDDREAAVITIDAVGTTLALSLDEGLTWRELGSAHGVHDLTAHVRGTYGYLLRLTLAGDAAVVRTMSSTTWV